jgi:molybdate transport system substrate-binding protein
LRSAGDGAAPVRAAVAANFAAAHDSLVAAFTARTRISVTATLGSSGQLYAQIAGGAPFDIFLSADTVRPARLVADGLARSDDRFPYAVGRLAVYAPRRTPVEDGAALIREGRFRHLAIANPEIAPYGAAAVEVLRTLGVWDAVRDRLVSGEHIGQTYQFVYSGAAEVGLVALAQVVAAEPRDVYWPVPQQFHTPLRQDAVILAAARDREAVRRYAEFLRSGDARAMIVRAGYAVPEAERAP